MEPLTLLLIIVGAGIVLFLLDLTLLGGGMSMGMMHGMAGMMSNPIGQGILLVLIAILGVLVYAVFFQ